MNELKIMLVLGIMLLLLGTTIALPTKLHGNQEKLSETFERYCNSFQRMEQVEYTSYVETENAFTCRIGYFSFLTGEAKFIDTFLITGDFTSVKNNRISVNLVFYRSHLELRHHIQGGE